MFSSNLYIIDLIPNDIIVDPPVVDEDDLSYLEIEEL